MWFDPRSSYATNEATNDMSTYRLDRLLAPRSIALIGGSPREKSVGRSILRNLREGGFPGSIQLINPHYREIDGVRTVARVKDLSSPPDMIVIVAPATVVPEIVLEAGAKGCAVAIVVTSGLGHGPGSLAEAARRNARSFGLRLVGPNCLGVLSPYAKLNASFAVQLPPAGDVALISQSGAIAAGLAQWGAQRNVGFSAIVSLGDQVDVDFGDVLDYFALDSRTRSVLLYMESINDARKFVSAARAAARTKPVVVVKAGRHTLGAKAAATHTGALAGSDAVYEAAFRRAGLLRVRDLDELFAAAEAIARVTPFAGTRLAILTNGGGIGVLAVDRLVDCGGTLAGLSEGTFKRLDQALPPVWSRANPVDIAGDADASRYDVALNALLEDEANDAVLVINVPTSLASPVEAAQAVVSTAQRHRTASTRHKPVFAAWIGDSCSASHVFHSADIPFFSNEADAVDGFMHLVRYHECQEALMRTPSSIPERFAPDVLTARRTVEEAIRAGRRWLGPLEIARLFDAYAIPITPVVSACSPEEAAARARPLLAAGKTVAVKIFSHDIMHKSDVGGVRLNVTSEDSVRDAAADIMARARTLKPEAVIDGVTIHPMILRPNAYELIVGIADDPIFGPIVVFGSGGTTVETIDDKALALPPLDLDLAHELIGRTRVSRILKGYRNTPAVDQGALALTLVKLAQLAADLPEIREIDINPLLADENGVIALDARVSIAPPEASGCGRRGHPRFTIRPYPKEWEKHSTLKDGTPIFIRPIRPEDERLYEHFFANVTADDLRLRFFAPIRTLDHRRLARFTQIDYSRAMAFIAIDKRSGELLGVCRLHADANYETAEYAILVRSDFKGRGLGWLLMQMMLDYARAEGLRTVHGQILAENTTMLTMCKELGFELAADACDPSTYSVRLAVS